MGFLLYEEYFLCNEELEQLRAQDVAFYETCRELMCHCYICLHVYHLRENVNGLKSWVDYLFPNLEGTPEEFQVVVSDEDITTMMTVSNHGKSFWRNTSVFTR